MAAKPGLMNVDARYVPETAHAPQSPASMKYLLAHWNWTVVLLSSLIFPSPPFQMNRTSAHAIALIPVRNTA